MRREHRFIPSLSDVIEDRLVLSAAAAHATHAASVAAFQGQNLALISHEINAAFATFAVNYSAAQAAYLSGTASNADLQQYDSDSVNSLVQQLGQYISTLPGATSSLASTVTAGLAGTNVGTLTQQLQSITSVGTNGQTIAQYAQQASNVILSANKTVVSAFQTLGNLVNEQLYSQYLTQNTPVSHKRLGPLQKFRQLQQEQVSNAVNQAFTTYFNSLNTARTGTLLVAPTAAGGVTTSTGPLDLSGNVNAYNTQLANATIALSNSLTTALAGVKGGLTTLQPSVVQSLFAPQTGLFSQLATMQTPTDLSGLSAQAFNNTVFNTVNTRYQDVFGRLNAFNQTPNTNFSTFTQFGNNGFVPSTGTNGFFTGLNSGLTTGNIANFASGFTPGFGLSGLNSFFSGTNFTGLGTSNNGTGLGSTGTGFGTGTSNNSTGLGSTGLGTSNNGTGLTTGTGTFTSGNGLTTFGTGTSNNGTGLTTVGSGFGLITGMSLGTVPSGSTSFGSGLGFGFGNGSGFGISNNGTGLFTGPINNSPTGGSSSIGGSASSSGSSGSASG